MSLGRAFEPGDVLVIWNRYSEMHLVASRAEAQGARVWVAENGYLGAGGTSPMRQLSPSSKPRIGMDRTHACRDINYGS